MEFWVNFSKEFKRTYGEDKCDRFWMPLTKEGENLELTTSRLNGIGKKTTLLPFAPGKVATSNKNKLKQILTKLLTNSYA